MMTLVIDRMEVDDVGGNPAKLADCLIRQIPNLKPRVPILEIAAAVDIEDIQEVSLVELEGGLITPDHKGYGTIFINSDRPPRRKKYTIAHELGHYLNPWHQPKDGAFNCNARDLSRTRQKQSNLSQEMEVQANEFAAELLMPSKLFQKQLATMSGLDIEHILNLSDQFDVSREAIARRFVSYSEEPSAVVFSKDNKVRYTRKHDDFPSLNVWNGQNLPHQSISVSGNGKVGLPSEWCSVDEEAWLKYPSRKEMYEQTMAQQNGFRITLLTIDNDEMEQEEWDAPSFSRSRRK